MGSPGEDEVRLRAWCLFEASGFQHGNHIDHWHEAERQLFQEWAKTAALEALNLEDKYRQQQKTRRQCMLDDKKKRAEEREVRWAEYYAARDAGFCGEYEEFVALKEAGEKIPIGPRNVGEVVLDRLGKFLTFLTGK